MRLLYLCLSVRVAGRRAVQLLALCALGLAWSKPGLATCSAPIRMAMQSWAPYIYPDAKGLAVGGDMEIMQAIFREAGCTLKVIPQVPGKRNMAMLQAGDLDMIPGASDIPERRAFAWFSKAYRDETSSLFTLAPKLKQYQDIDGFTSVLSRKISLLSPAQGWYGDDHAAHLDRLNQAKLNSSFEGIPQGLVMLSRGRGEVLVADRAAVFYEAKKLGLVVAVLPYAAAQAPVHMMFGKKTVPEADVLLLDAAAQRLEATGELKRIRQSYGME